MPGVVDRLIGLADGSYVDRVACDAAFERMSRRDAVGDRLHLLFAGLGLFAVFGPTTVTEIAFAPLLVFFFVRVVNAGRVWVHGFGQPVPLCAYALAAWLGITLLWSPDRAAGLEEISQLRWLVLLALIYPAIRERSVLVHALAYGLIVATVAQLLSATPVLAGAFPNRHPTRVSGWWDPVVAGSIQVGAVGLFLPAGVWGLGRARGVGVMGLALSLGGLVATGTRGAWIAGALLLLIAGPVALRRASRRAAVAGVVAALLGVVAAGVVFGPRLAVRVGQARQEFAAAADGDLSTPTGERMAVMRRAWETGLARPLRGGGAGCVGADGDWPGSPDGGAPLRHAHSMPLQLFATGGVPAVLLGGLLVAVALRNAWRARPTDSRRALEAGLPWAVLGVVLAGLFDSVLVNAQTAAVLGAFAALSPAYWPGGPARAEARGS